MDYDAIAIWRQVSSSIAQITDTIWLNFQNSISDLNGTAIKVSKTYINKKIIKFCKSDNIMIPCSHVVIFCQNLCILFVNHINKNNVSVLILSSFNLRPKPLFFLQNKQFLLINDVSYLNVTSSLLIYYR